MLSGLVIFVIDPSQSSELPPEMIVPKIVLDFTEIWTQAQKFAVQHSNQLSHTNFDNDKV